MTEEIIIDKEGFWDMFEKHPINAVEGLFSKIETIVNLITRLEQENKELKKENETLNYQWHKRTEIGDEWYKVAENYRSALDTIQRMVLSAWEQGKYLDGGLYDDLTNEFTKINEVLNDI